MTGRLDRLLDAFERYDPADQPRTADFWPPRVRPARWGGDRRKVDEDAVHYHREEIAALMARMLDRGVCGGTVLVSDFYSGLGLLLWGQMFERVCSISVRDAGVPYFVDGKYEIAFGRVGDMPFMYRALERFGPLDALIIDGPVRYELVMILYYTFRRAVRPGGLVAFFNTADVPANRFIRRFLDDLRGGEADGIRHDLWTLDAPAGAGIVGEWVA